MEELEFSRGQAGERRTRVGTPWAVCSVFRLLSSSSLNPVSRVSYLSRRELIAWNRKTRPRQTTRDPDCVVTSV